MSMSTDLLKKAIGKAKTKKSTVKTKELRVITVADSMKPEIRVLCELGYLTDQIKGPLGQNKTTVQKTFFEMWTDEMFKAKKKPDNFRVVLGKPDDKGVEQPAVNDVKCTFQLKFRSNGIADKCPKPGEFPMAEDGETPLTVHEVLIAALQTQLVGLSEANAKEFVTDEVSVEDVVELAMPLSQMCAHEDGTAENAIAMTILTALTKSGKGKTVTVPTLTDEQKENALVMHPVVSLKEGMLDRIFSYCETIEQLRKLLTFCNVTLQIANFDFGMSDAPADRSTRMKEIIGQYLVGDE